MNKRLKVLHVINSLTPGGAENLLVNSLSHGGLQEHVDNELIYFNGDSHLVEKLDPSVKIYNLNYKGKWGLFKLLLDLKSKISKNKYDIIHTHLSPACLYTTLVRPVNIPQIHTIHSTYSVGDKKKNKILTYLERKFFLERKLANVITTSEFNKDDLLKSLHFKGNLFVLNNFIEDIYFVPHQKQVKEKDILKVIAVGNLREEKNYIYLIEVFGYLKNYNIFLDVYGNGDAEKFNQFAKSKNITKINFRGGVPNIHKLINNYDLFIMPSKVESFGLSAFEAMVSGVPAMLSDIPSIKSIVKDNAIYFRLNDAESAAKQLIQICHDEVDINSLAEKAKQYAETVVKREVYLKRLLNIYQDIHIPKVE